MLLDGHDWYDVIKPFKLLGVCAILHYEYTDPIHCMYIALVHCMIEDNHKTKCGRDGIVQSECEAMDNGEAKGCCWNESTVSGVPFCYYQSGESKCLHTWSCCIHAVVRHLYMVLGQEHSAKIRTVKIFSYIATNH